MSMQPSSLALCPCGKTPSRLHVSADRPHAKWQRVSGDCCDAWAIPFRAIRFGAGADETMDRAVAAWNNAPRGLQPQDEQQALPEFRELPPEWDALIREFADYFRDPVVMARGFRAEVVKQFASEDGPPSIESYTAARENVRELFQQCGPLPWPLDMDLLRRRHAAAEREKAATAAAENRPPNFGGGGSYVTPPGSGCVWDREIGDDAEPGYFE